MGLFYDLFLADMTARQTASHLASELKWHRDRDAEIAALQAQEAEEKAKADAEAKAEKARKKALLAAERAKAAWKARCSPALLVLSSEERKTRLATKLEAMKARQQEAAYMANPLKAKEALLAAVPSKSMKELKAELKAKHGARLQKMK